MDTEGLYQRLRRIQARDEIGNAYGGCGTVEEESNVLVDFFEWIMEKYKDSMPFWAEAFIQIFGWQFQTFHEGAESYYSNFYGNSEYAAIIRTADYLNENGYDEIWKPYISAAVDCERYKYPKEKAHLLPDDWMNENEKTVWNFYVNILEKHADELTMKEVDVKLDGQVVQLKIRRAFHSRNPLTSRYYVNLMEAGHERGIRLCCRGREDAEMLTKKIREGKITDLTGYPAEWNQ